MITSEYGTDERDAKTNAAIPITGGIICPPVDAAASTPPAKAGLKTVFIIIGIVRVPVPRTFTTGPPEIVPKVAYPTIAAWADPPRSFRVMIIANFMSACQKKNIIVIHLNIKNIKKFSNKSIY
jgi:hypothetical protein